MNHENNNVIDRLSASLKQENKPLIGGRLIEYELALNEAETARFHHGLADCASQIETVCNIRKSDIPENTIRGITEQINAYEMLKDELNHRQRRYQLEKMVRLLRPVCDDETYRNSKLLLLLSKVWLYRSLLFRPKGYTTPARKIEALKNAVNLSFEVATSEKTNKEALRLWAISSLELNATGEESYIINKKMLSEAANIISQDKYLDLNDFRIIVEDSERNNNTDLLDKIINEKDHWDRKCDLYLYKARAALQMKKLSEMEEYLKQTMLNAPEALSDPFWEEFVDFLKRLKASENNAWIQNALDAHELCRSRELEVGNNVYLSWHWSRQKSLYDLAFIAADKEDKVNIADSVKSRPFLRYQVLHDMKKWAQGHGMEKWLKKIENILNDEDEGRDGRYLKKNPGIIKKSVKDKNPPAELLPQPWTAIHLYLNETEDETGYALIYNKDTGWLDPIPFKYDRMFAEYASWQDAYHSSGESTASTAIVLLCREIGRSMPFLFNPKIIPNKSPVLWIPHGFLHRLPLHSAICENTDTVFLENHMSRYLPAWNLFPVKPLEKGKGTRLLMCVGEDRELFKKITSMTWDDQIDQANDKDLKSAMGLSPEILAVICHGHGDVVNPFRSWLELDNSELSILDLLKHSAKIKGAGVMLGACESDMVPPMDRPVDEHVSISTAYLSHGASEVIAGLWKIGMENVDKWYSKIRDTEDWAASLQTWQKKSVKGWKQSKKDEIFYDLAPFRITGFNVPAQDKGASE